MRASVGGRKWRCITASWIEVPPPRIDNQGVLGMDRFAWVPGKGIDASALERLRSHFPRPVEPMGEAWFMGSERRMFKELLNDLDSLSAYEIQKPLEEIASGTSAFGPLAEWTSWYHHLLGALLPRSHEHSVDYILEYLITGFMSLHPNGIQQSPYKNFREDILNSLGSAIMDDGCWNDGDIAIGKILHSSDNNPNRVWCWWDASGDMSSSMFFCLKYLPQSLVADWFGSALAIPSPHWRAQMIAWLVGSHAMLSNAVKWPSEWNVEARPSVSWAWSHCLRPELATNERNSETPMSSLLPDAAKSEVIRVVSEHFTDAIFLDWLSSIAEVPYLETELAEIPATFERLYLDAARS